MFRKSGEEAWKAWVPILNLVVLLRLGGLSGWLLLLGLVPGLGLIAVWVVVVIACHRIGAAFGFGPGMTVLAALLLPVVGVGDRLRHEPAGWVPRRSPGARRTATPIDDDGPAVHRGHVASPHPRTPAPALRHSSPDLPASAAAAARRLRAGWTPPAAAAPRQCRPRRPLRHPPLPPTPSMPAAPTPRGTRSSAGMGSKTSTSSRVR